MDHIEAMARAALNDSLNGPQWPRLDGKGREIAIRKQGSAFDALIASVPDLVWDAAGCGRGFIAVTPLGQYAVFDEGDPRWAISLGGGSGYKYIKADTLALAKAAANAHNREQVRNIWLQKKGDV